MSTKGYSWSWSEKAKQKRKKYLDEHPEVKKILGDRLKEYYKEHARPNMKGFKWSEKQKKKHCERMREVNNRPKVKEAFAKRAKEFSNRPERRKRHSELMKELSNRPEMKKTLSERGKKAWENPEKRKIFCEERKRRWAKLTHEERLAFTLPGRMAVRSVSKGEMALYEIVHQYYPTAKNSEWVKHYQIDIAIPELKIDIEYDGARWHPLGNEKDKKRDEFLQKLGWAILRAKEGEEFDINILHELVKSRSEHGQDTRLQRTGSC